MAFRINGRQPNDEPRMKKVMNIHAAKTHFSKLLADVARGEEIIIAKDGVPVARLVAYASETTPRPLGLYAGKLWMADDALETPEWLIDAFEGVGANLPHPTAPDAPRKTHVAEAVPLPPARKRRP